jgi:hypothetical protein
MRPLDWILGAGLLVASGWFSHQGDAARRAMNTLPLPLEQKAPERLSSFSLVSALGGMRRVASDWSYVEQLQYFGNTERWQADKFASYMHWGTEIMWLDPHFYHAIEENGVVLGFWKGFKNDALEYLRRAAIQDPAHDRYQELIAALLYESESEPKKTIALLKKDILRGTASEMTLRIVGNLYIKHENWAEAKEHWTKMCVDAEQKPTLKRCLEVGILLKKKGY